MKVSNSNANEKYWLGHIRQAEQSGETFKRYAECHGLNLKSLYDWRCRLKNKCVLDFPPRSAAKRAGTFAKVVAVPPTHHTGIELRIGGVPLSADALPDPVWLANLVQALELR